MSVRSGVLRMGFRRPDFLEPPPLVRVPRRAGQGGEGLPGLHTLDGAADAELLSRFQAAGHCFGP